MSVIVYGRFVHMKMAAKSPHNNQNDKSTRSDFMTGPPQARGSYVIPVQERSALAAA